MRGRCYFLCLLLAAPIFAGQPAFAEQADLPLWIREPKTSDGLYDYALGRSRGATTPEAAHESALQNARETLARRLDERLKGSQLTTASPVPGAVYRSEDGRDCTVLLRAELREVDALRAQIAKGKRINALATSARQALGRSDFDAAEQALKEILNLDGPALFAEIHKSEARALLADIAARRSGARLDQDWRQAQSDFAAGRHAEARRRLEVILQDYALAGKPAFDLLDAEKLLADTLAALALPLEARPYYEKVIRLGSEAQRAAASQSLVALPAPPPAWPLRERWDAQPVALRVSLGDAAYDLLADRLAAEFTNARIAMDPSSRLVLEIRVVIDPALTGRTTRHFNADIPIKDARAAVKLRQGEKLLWQATLEEDSSGQPPARFADRLSILLIKNVLVPKAPAVESLSAP